MIMTINNIVNTNNTDTNTDTDISTSTNTNTNTNTNTDTNTDLGAAPSDMKARQMSVATGRYRQVEVNVCSVYKQILR